MDNDNKMLKAMYRGELSIADLILDCAVLEDDTRVLSSISVFNTLGRMARGLHLDRSVEYMELLNQINPNHDLCQVPPFLSSKGIISLIDKDFLLALKPIQYLENDKIIEGYMANILPQICSLYLKARRDGLLKTSQKGC